MHIFIEDKFFRNKLHVFMDRNEAGKFLSQSLVGYKDTDAIVLGIPSGGVPVAAEIARSLALPLDLLIVRKVQIPYNKEAGFGAVSPDNRVLLNEKLLNMLNLSEKEVEQQIQTTRNILKKRNELFREGRTFPTVKNKIAIIVDDGLASGYTMFSAIAFIKSLEPQKIVVAVPTGSEETVNHVLTQVDELVCLNVRSNFIFAVADAYENWYDLEDNEVNSILHDFKESS